ncbi:MAG: hypothetical protein EA419_05475 [Wenzhouxiangella sp.]|nr:MAG: hypothetical protein EA419_05475 [Wenzhouxiangella sp.]
MRTINRWLGAVVAGLAVSIVLAEAVLALLELVTGAPSLMAVLASGQPLAGWTELVLICTWLVAAVPGGFMAAALGRLAVLALAVGLGCGAAPALTALVGGQSDSAVLVFGLTPLLGALLGARLARRVQALDRRRPVTAVAVKPEL